MERDEETWTDPLDPADGVSWSAPVVRTTVPAPVFVASQGLEPLTEVQGPRPPEQRAAPDDPS